MSVGRSQISNKGISQNTVHYCWLESNILSSHGSPGLNIDEELKIQSTFSNKRKRWKDYLITKQGQDIIPWTKWQSLLLVRHEKKENHLEIKNLPHLPQTRRFSENFTTHWYKQVSHSELIYKTIKLFSIWSRKNKISLLVEPKQE